MRFEIAQLDYMKSKLRSSGFSFIELLVVISIILVISGMVLAAIGRAKRSAYMADSMNNLRQCYTALAVYVEDRGWADLPGKDKAIAILNSGITFDKSDSWRRSASEPSPYPAMVGSYGYINSDVCFNGKWGSCVPIVSIGGVQTFPVLVSLFYNDTKIPPGSYVSELTTVPMPTRVLTLWNDGHAVFEPVLPFRHAAKEYECFLWNLLFAELALSGKKG